MSLKDQYGHLLNPVTTKPDNQKQPSLAEQYGSFLQNIPQQPRQIQPITSPENTPLPLSDNRRKLRPDEVDYLKSTQWYKELSQEIGGEPDLYPKDEYGRPTFDYGKALDSGDRPDTRVPEDNNRFHWGSTGKTKYHPTYDKQFEGLQPESTQLVRPDIPTSLPPDLDPEDYMPALEPPPEAKIFGKDLYQKPPMMGTTAKKSHEPLLNIPPEGLTTVKLDMPLKTFEQLYSPDPEVRRKVRASLGWKDLSERLEKSTEESDEFYGADPYPYSADGSGVRDTAQEPYSKAEKKFREQNSLLNIIGQTARTGERYYKGLGAFFASLPAKINNPELFAEEGSETPGKDVAMQDLGGLIQMVSQLPAQALFTILSAAGSTPDQADDIPQLVDKMLSHIMEEPGVAKYYRQAVNAMYQAPESPIFAGQIAGGGIKAAKDLIPSKFEQGKMGSKLPPDKAQGYLGEYMEGKESAANKVRQLTDEYFNTKDELARKQIREELDYISKNDPNIAMYADAEMTRIMGEIPQETTKPKTVKLEPDKKPTDVSTPATDYKEPGKKGDIIEGAEYQGKFPSDADMEFMRSKGKKAEQTYTFTLEEEGKETTLQIPVEEYTPELLKSRIDEKLRLFKGDTPKSPAVEKPAPKAEPFVRSPLGDKVIKKPQPLTKKQRADLKDTKVVDTNGEPVPIYSGHWNLDTYGMYSPDRSASGGFYATTSPEVASNYAKNKQFRNLDYEWEKGYRFPDNKTIGDHKLNKAEEKRLIDAVLSYETDPGGGAAIPKSTLDWDIREHKGDVLRGAFETMVNSGTIPLEDFTLILDKAGIKHSFTDAWASQPGVITGYLDIRNPIDAAAVPDKVIKAVSKIKTITPGDDPAFHVPVKTGKEYAELMKDDKGGWAIDVPKEVRDKLKELGYDGIKQPGGLITGSEPHTTWIAFDANQIINRFKEPQEQPQVKTEQTEAGEQVTFAPQRQVPDAPIKKVGKKKIDPINQGDVFIQEKLKTGNLPQDQKDMFSSGKQFREGTSESDISVKEKLFKRGSTHKNPKVEDTEGLDVLEQMFNADEKITKLGSTLIDNPKDKGKGKSFIRVGGGAYNNFPFWKDLGLDYTSLSNAVKKIKDGKGVTPKQYAKLLEAHKALREWQLELYTKDTPATDEDIKSWMDNIDPEDLIMPFGIVLTATTAAGLLNSDDEDRIWAALGGITSRDGKRLRIPKVGKAPIWYSKLGEGLENKLGGTKKISSKQVVDMIDSMVKKGEVKKEEVEWSSLYETLKEQPNVKLDREKLSEMIRNDMIEVIEVERVSDLDIALKEDDVYQKLQDDHAAKRMKYVEASGELRTLGNDDLVREFTLNAEALFEKYYKRRPKSEVEFVDFISLKKNVDGLGKPTADMGGSGYLETAYNNGFLSEYAFKSDIGVGFAKYIDIASKLSKNRLLQKKLNLELTRLESQMRERLSAVREKKKVQHDNPRWNEPGGEDYRELILKLPAGFLLPKGWEIKENKGYFDAYKDGKLQTTASSIKRLHEWIDGEAGYNVAHYGSTLHYPDPNIIAWARIDKRDNGKELFTQEIQSDWHQVGRDLGYQDRETRNKYLDEIEKAKGDFYKGVDEIPKEILAVGDQTELVRLKGSKTLPITAFNSKVRDILIRAFHQRMNIEFPGKNISAWESLGYYTGEFKNSPEYEYVEKINQLSNRVKEAENQLFYELREGEAVPDAPFKNWADIIMKRLLLYAAANGYKTLSWTPGWIQNKRWSLSNVVDKIVVYKKHGSHRVDPGYVIMGYENGAKTIEKTVSTKKDLADHIGKELAEQAIQKVEPPEITKELIDKYKKIATVYEYKEVLSGDDIVDQVHYRTIYPDGEIEVLDTEKTLQEIKDDWVSRGRGNLARELRLADDIMREIHFAETTREKEGGTGEVDLDGLISPYYDNYASTPEAAIENAVKTILTYKRREFVAEGNALEVGGTGKKQLYDIMVNKIVEKIGKKYGARVYESELPGAKDSNIWKIRLPDGTIRQKIFDSFEEAQAEIEFQNYPEGTKVFNYNKYEEIGREPIVWKIDISEQMAKDLNTKGLPLFGVAILAALGLASLTDDDKEIDMSNIPFAGLLTGKGKRKLPLLLSKIAKDISSPRRLRQNRIKAKNDFIRYQNDQAAQEANAPKRPEEAPKTIEGKNAQLIANKDLTRILDAARAGKDISTMDIGRKAIYRNTRKVLGKAGEEVLDLFDEQKSKTIDGVLNDLGFIKKEIWHKYGAKPGSKMSAMIQKYGEQGLIEDYKNDITNLEIALENTDIHPEVRKDMLKYKKQIQKDLKELEGFDYDSLVKKVGKKRADQVVEADKAIREFYDKSIDAINDVRVQLRRGSVTKYAVVDKTTEKNKDGFKRAVQIHESRAEAERHAEQNENKNLEVEVRPGKTELIPKHKHYYRHFQGATTGMGQLASLFETPQQISAKLVNISEYTHPNTKWKSMEQERMGTKTTYDAVGGLVDYVQQKNFAIHLDPMVTYFNKLLNGLKEATDGKNNINNYISFIDHFQQHLAGKTNPFDRFLQSFIGGRTGLQLLNWFNGRVSGNTVGLSASTLFVQPVNVVQGMAEAKQYFIPGLIYSIAAPFMPNAPYKFSSFNKERFKAGMELDYFDASKRLRHPFLQGGYMSQWLMGNADKIGTLIIWNSLYLKALSQGNKDPYKFADNKTRDLVGGRGIGEMGLVFKSVAGKAVLAFQYEVDNIWQIMGDWTLRADNKLLGLNTLLQFFLYTYIANEMYERLFGRRVMIDLIDASKDVYEIISNPDLTAGQKAFKTVGRYTGEAIGEMAGGQVAAQFVPKDTRKQFFGSEDPARYGDPFQLMRVTSDVFQSVAAYTAGDIEKGNKEALNVAYRTVLPQGGGQIKKTVSGIELLKDGSYYYNNKYQYSIDPNNPEEMARALFFGAYGTQGAFNYREQQKEKNR